MRHQGLQGDGGLTPGHMVAEAGQSRGADRGSKSRVLEDGDVRLVRKPPEASVSGDDSPTSFGDLKQRGVNWSLEQKHGFPHGARPVNLLWPCLLFRCSQPSSLDGSLGSSVDTINLGAHSLSSMWSFPRGQPSFCGSQKGLECVVLIVTSAWIR